MQGDRRRHTYTKCNSEHLSRKCRLQTRREGAQGHTATRGSHLDCLSFTKACDTHLNDTCASIQSSGGGGITGMNIDGGQPSKGTIYEVCTDYFSHQYITMATAMAQAPQQNIDKHAQCVRSHLFSLPPVTMSPSSRHVNMAKTGPV